MPHLRISNVRADVTEPEDRLPRRLARLLEIGQEEIVRWRILRKSLDARSRGNLQFVYTFQVELPETDRVLRRLAGKPIAAEPFTPLVFQDPELGPWPLEHRPVVIGSGPAGLLAGYYLALRGFRPLIVERGQPVKQRVPAIRAFETGGEHDPENNYLFGEGGAGT
ncbi:MAG: NAD(P)-binding protein, partial [Thermoguttaceae bacterium]